ncbi:MAG: hypothetical protein A3A44_01755 [Candidatus Sungbacteria bacterium RIFCSPLOWO2_01_FULL_60_25]|uniref:Uncharacterized protein n=1 Tax=Candidatus Sungbacteria bacterium RIFCSPLOWO2_01_FULL_60_25 TaxID=1802281 RepID=A0A1G2LAY6_9BACT|nr:MAG: hypothetical protein A3A44_01755 [Candidatus Sungbacteria bacterium RIFCSPLOWO2_01_FULL_60_25]
MRSPLWPRGRLRSPVRLPFEAAERSEKVAPPVLRVKPLLLNHAPGERPEVGFIVHLRNPEVSGEALRFEEHPREIIREQVLPRVEVFVGGESHVAVSG